MGPGSRRRCMEVSHDRPEFAEQLPLFVARIKGILEPHEIAAFFAALEAGQIFDPAKFFNGGDPDVTGPDENEVLVDAERILLIENAKRLLLPDAPKEWRDEWQEARMHLSGMRHDIPRFSIA